MTGPAREIPRLGLVQPHQAVEEWLSSEPIVVPALGGHICRIVFDDYEGDDDKESLHVAIANFLSGDRNFLEEATPFVFAYYEDTTAFAQSLGWPCITIDRDDIWSHVRLGEEAHVTRRSDGDGRVYISMECNCAWEEEHGLQLVFKEGRSVTKVGPFDGHLTNSDTFGDPALEGVVYCPNG